MKAGREITELSRLEFLGKISGNIFALSSAENAENSASGQLNRGGIADLPLLRILFAIRQHLQEPRFREVKGIFVLLV